MSKSYPTEKCDPAPIDICFNYYTAIGSIISIIAILPCT